MKPIRALITGGAGFIGSHLTDALLEQGFDVTILDNLSTGRQANLDHLKGNKHLYFHECDITKSPEKLKNYFNGIDWVFHLAALADIVPSIVDPESYFRANVDGTFAVLELARHAGVKRFIYSASSSCYGIPDIYPTSESSPIKPQYPYALTKYLGECTVMHWGSVYKLPVVSLRLFNVYGPRSRTSGTYGAVIGTFLAQKIHGKPFTVVGDGSQRRDFVYVKDVAQAFIASAKSSVVNEIFNVGSGGTYSIKMLVEYLGGEVVHIPKRPGEPDQTYADISKIQKQLHWSPKVTFAEGIGSVLKNIDYWKNAPVWNPRSIQKATKEWFLYLK